VLFSDIDDVFNKVIELVRDDIARRELEERALQKARQINANLAPLMTAVINALSHLE